ncbi:cation efflux family protein [Flavobacterium cauense R2A-7]|uniref:Cation efflux family protein n=1 Tax=Flavobacterium cauense R2A-7 TaxID=1341154 RepID=A0A562LP08_9FLAO|nr:cation diffusion facilitator family transporter [Flavobacterium cauense]KGO80359.1 cation transporter [Flavobacterium cauense R2A-7]TWI09364.1 cation efflux family protein [Flavobacterium cauense R2A-7]
MNKSIYKIAKMDCPSEEQLIRLKLNGIEQIQQLNFDIPNRKLEVFHSGDTNLITDKINSLNLDSSLEKTEITSESIKQSDDTQQRKLLWQVLGINAFFFALEMVTGFVSNSMGLVADSLDMLADSIVYALALFAVGGAMARKNNIAKMSGYFQLLLAILGFIEVLRRFLGFTEVPAFQTMIIISLLALVGNVICLYLLQKSKSKEAHMQASMIFTSNDVVVNIGVIVAGMLVYFTNSKIPDLVIGVLVFAVVGKGALRILKLSNEK